MSYEETAVMNFLKGYPDVFVAKKEIARKAMKRTHYEENPRWADAPITSLLNQGMIEQDDGGSYRIKNKEV